MKKVLLAIVAVLLITAPSYADNKHIALIQDECANKHVALLKKDNCSCQVNGKICVCEEGRCPSCPLIPTAAPSVSKVRYSESYQSTECQGGNCSQSSSTVRGLGIFRRYQ